MIEVSINLLTKDRAAQLRTALESIAEQTFQNFEVVIVNDGSTDDTGKLIEEYQNRLPLVVITHGNSQGITSSRQEALKKSSGTFVAILDDDDAWVDREKLQKQVEFLQKHSEYVLAGGGMEIVNYQNSRLKFRPETDQLIRKTMLVRNNFFTSTVMFRRQAALEAGGFIKDNFDLGEDYDLCLRLGKKGRMYNFQEVFTKYTPPSYNKAKFRQFLIKQLQLVTRHKQDYPNYWLARILLTLRVNF